MNTFMWLLKREYWENRGGFKWAPAIAGGITLLLTTMGILVGEITAQRHGVRINSLNLGDIANSMSPENLAHFGAALDIFLYMMAIPVGIALFFVLFFYLLGSLYDERRDRSILFWKSLPISDAETVLAKVATAAVVAPVLSSIATLLLMLGFLIVLSIFAAVHGVNPFTTIWWHASPFSVAAKFIAMLPVNALWAAPTIGWLMLCSAFARRVPFLWATLLPVGVGLMVSWFDLMQNFRIPDAWFWKNVVARLLFSVAPGSWENLDRFEQMEKVSGPADVMRIAGQSNMLEVLGSANLWLGVLAGVAMIAGAIWLRRWRDDS